MGRSISTIPWQLEESALDRGAAWPVWTSQRLQLLGDRAKPWVLLLLLWPHPSTNPPAFPSLLLFPVGCFFPSSIIPTGGFIGCGF